MSDDKKSDLITSVPNDSTHISAEEKYVKDERTNISVAIPVEREKDWWCDTDAVTRIIMLLGLVACTIVLSCSMRVGALKELSDKADLAVTQCVQISNRLDNVTKMIGSFNNEVQRHFTTSTNTLLNISSMIDDVSNQVERICSERTEGKADNDGKD